MVDRTSVFGRRDRIIVQEVEHQAVLLDIESGEYFALNEVGSRVWELCDGARTVAQVADTICAEYEVPPDTALDDTVALLENLAGAGLVIEG